MRWLAVGFGCVMAAVANLVMGCLLGDWLSWVLALVWAGLAAFAVKIARMKGKKAMTDVESTIYQATRDYLTYAAANPPRNDAPSRKNVAHTYVSEFGRFGVKLTINGVVDYFSTIPGGQTLMMSGVPPSYPGFPVVALDFAFDLSDDMLRRMRDPIVAALTDAGEPFMPVSLNALQNLGGSQIWNQLELVDRDGLQCIGRVGDLYFISGYDANEDPPLYFLARLPHPVTSYAEGIEALKPKSVKLAEADGLTVRRQGDMFAIPTTWRSHDLQAMGAVFSTNVEVTHRVPAPVAQMRALRREMQRFTISVGAATIPAERAAQMVAESEDGYITVTDARRRGLYGTAHTATELAYLPDGTMFARGTIEHDPHRVLLQRREPDHAPLVLPGKTWWLIARNTVPIQGRR
jgi:hypothetical protein